MRPWRTRSSARRRAPSSSHAGAAGLGWLGGRAATAAPRCPAVCRAHGLHRSPTASPCWLLPQVLNALAYYLGLTYIPDARVVDQLLGVPTYQLHEAVEVRGRRQALRAAAAGGVWVHGALARGCRRRLHACLAHTVRSPLLPCLQGPAGRLLLPILSNPALAQAGVAAGLSPQEATAFANISRLLVASTATGALGGRQAAGALHCRRRWLSHA